MMGNDDRPYDPNHQNVIDISSDEEQLIGDLNYEDAQTENSEDWQEEKSSYFPQSEDVRNFNSRSKCGILPCVSFANAIGVNGVQSFARSRYADLVPPSNNKYTGKASRGSRTRGGRGGGPPRQGGRTSSTSKVREGFFPAMEQAGHSRTKESGKAVFGGGSGTNRPGQKGRGNIRGMAP